MYFFVLYPMDSIQWMASIVLLFALFGHNNFYVFVGYLYFYSIKALSISMANYSTDIVFVILFLILKNFL